MRFLYLLLLLLLVAVVVIFVVLNRDYVPINYYDQHLEVQSVSVPMALLVPATYVLGMLSGWTVVGILKRSVQGITEHRQQS